ncbi:MAG: hypothetical protein LBT90_02085 [Holosporaceae bacterium]|jgi:uncharacterized protein YbaR (Trm112 family)|nr:hypothetical protein [Holosporaceae bacterium]
MSGNDNIQNRETPLISDALLRIIVCPVSGCALELDGDKLVSYKVCTSYKIFDGIPILVARENGKNFRTDAKAKKCKK